MSNKTEISPVISHLVKFKTAYIFSLVFLISFFIRLAYLLDYQGSPFFYTPIVDAQLHDDWAKDIEGGDVFSLKQGEVLYKAPLYPYFMALVYWIFGHNFFILRTIQIVIGSLSCAILFLIAQYYTNHRYAFISALLYSLYFVAIYFDNEIEIPCIAIFLTLLSFFLLKRAHKKSCLISSAISLGLSIIALPSNLLLLPLFVATIYKRIAMKRAALYLSIALIPILPFTIRNVAVGKTFVMVSANAGLNFYIGNNPDYDTTTSIRPGLEWYRFIGQAGPPSAVVHEKYWFKKAFTYIAHHPIHYLKLNLKKLVLYFMGYEIMRNRDICFAWKSSILSAFPFITLRVLLPLGLLGVFLLARKFKANWDLYALLLLLLFPAIVFFVTSRYRLPSVAIWSIFAGLAIGKMAEFVTERMWRSMLFCLCFLLVTGTVVSRGLFVVKNDPSRKYYNLGNVFLAQGDVEKAIESYRKALPLMGETTENKRLTKAEVLYTLGAAYQKQGDMSQALNFYDRAISLVSNYGRVFLAKCETYLDQKNYMSAFDTIIEAMEKGSLFHGIDEVEKAYELLTNSLYLARPSEQRVKELVNRFRVGRFQAVLLNYMGEQRLEQGQYEEAKRLFQLVLRLDAKNARAISNLANAGMTGGDPIIRE